MGAFGKERGIGSGFRIGGALKHDLGGGFVELVVDGDGSRRLRLRGVCHGG